MRVDSGESRNGGRLLKGDLGRLADCFVECKASLRKVTGHQRPREDRVEFFEYPFGLKGTLEPEPTAHVVPVGHKKEAPRVVRGLPDHPELTPRRLQGFAMKPFQPLHKGALATLSGSQFGHDAYGCGLSRRTRVSRRATKKRHAHGPTILPTWPAKRLASD